MTTTKETIGNITIVTITNPDQEFLRYIFDGDSKTLTITGDSLNVIITDISSIEAVYQNDDNTLTIIDTNPDSDLLFIGLSGKINSVSRVHHQDAHGTFERILHQL